MSTSIYSFENNGRRKFPDRNSEDAALKEFAARLGFDGIDYEEHRSVLLNFILSYHKVISRYIELRTREMMKRVLFTVVSLALLLAIPLLIFAMGWWISGDKSTVTAQLTAVLTGLLAVHKSLSSWLDKRKVIGNFWKAESELKAKLYGFEDKWRGNTTVGAKTANGDMNKKLKGEFVKDAHSSIAEAREVVQEEQTKFFEAVTYPSIDLGDMLKSSGDRAKSIVGAHISPELEQREKKRQSEEALEGKINEQKDKIVRLEVEIQQRNQLIDKKRQMMQAATQEEIDALNLEVKTHQTKIRQVEDELVIAMSQLGALQRSGTT